MATQHRRPIIGDPVNRTHRMETKLSKAEVEALDVQVKQRRCNDRADYVRFLIEADYQGRLMLIDDGFFTMAEIVGRAFGGAAAELTAQADLYRIQKGLGEL
jgi:hypothetical protein